MEKTESMSITPGLESSDICSRRILQTAQSPQTVFVEVLFGGSLTGHRGWGQRTVLVCAGCPRSPSPSACPDAPENLHKDKSS